jgi:phosphate ABC transporter permease protein PstC
VEARAPTLGGGPSIFESSPLGRLPDRVLRFGLAGIAAAVLVLLAAFFVTLVSESSDAFSSIGIFSFLFHNNWDTAQLQQGGACAAGASHCTFGAWPMILGTLLTAGIALVIGVPIAVATALYLTELCPRRARGPLSLLVDLLAAVPSVVYGLWGFVVLAPKLRGFQQFLADKLSFLPFWAGQVAGPSYFLAGLILAVMILPIVSAISREVIATVPAEHKEAALALGATRWEMIRYAVIPYARPGITGAAMLGLGRAIGETIAVAYVIGGSTTLGHSIFQQGQSLAGVIALQFGEAESTPLYKSTLLAAGLILFVLTLLVNLLARRYVVRAGRSKRIGGDAAPGLGDPLIQGAEA